MASRRGLQGLLSAIGVVALAAGVRDAVGGTGGVVGEAGKVAPANVDSEFRFYAVWYAVLGALVLRAARRPESEGVAVQACGAGFLAAGCTRLLSWRKAGRPHGFIGFLTVLEFLIPVVIVPWQRRLSR
jgi:Domain of unknown function (DUF4345)